MANSLRVKLKKLCHDGKIEQSELDVLLSKLDGHDQQIRNEAIQIFAEWLEKMDYLNEVNVEYDYEENGYEVCLGLTKDDVLSQYEEHLKGGAE